MGELTPYPSHKDLYSDDGLRELYFNHRGSKYVVIDDFSLGKHSIFKDDELLHENLNPSMMKAVVKELFGIDKTLADILTDDVVLLPESEEGYLMRSVRNRCLNQIAHKSVKERVAKLLLYDADVILSEDTDERLEQLLLLIDDLEPPIRKLIFRLRYLQDKSYQEVADEVGVSKVVDEKQQLFETLVGVFRKNHVGIIQQ
jgi:RNA polymerase sigma-70 factor (ECF subfamily)